MKIAAVKDLKGYEDVNGDVHERKRDAEKINADQARVEIITAFLASFLGAAALAALTPDGLIYQIATNWEELSELMVEE